MTREEYIRYLRNQAYYMERLAIELSDDLPIDQISTWTVDFDMLHPSEIVEPKEIKEDKQVA